MRIVHVLEVRSSFASGPFISEFVILSKETYYASQTYKLIKVRIHCVRAEAVLFFSLCLLTFSCPMSSCFVCNIPLNRCLSGYSCMQGNKGSQDMTGSKVRIHIYILYVYITQHTWNIPFPCFFFSL